MRISTRLWRPLTSALLAAMLLLTACSPGGGDPTPPDGGAPTSPTADGGRDGELDALQSQIVALQAELLARVGHLENFFDRETPQGVADLWGRAVCQRNGAVQYALYDEALQEQSYTAFNDMGWHTGASTPHAESYRVDAPVTGTDGQVLVGVSIRMTGGSMEPYDEASVLVLARQEDGWRITAVQEPQP